jgi:hypothetical protein
LKY